MADGLSKAVHFHFPKRLAASIYTVGADNKLYPTPVNWRKGKTKQKAWTAGRKSLGLAPKQGKKGGGR